MGVPSGSNLGAAHGSITISTTQAQQAVPVMQGVASGVQRAMAGIGTASGNAESSVRMLTRAFHDLAGAAGLSLGVAGVAQLGRMAFEMAQTAAQAELTEKAFERLAAGVGAASDELLDAMREASHGTVTEAQMILGANRAIVGGVADSADELAQIMEIARASGQAFGFSTAEAFDRIVRATSKLEPELLDELGIAMRLDTVFRAFAATLGKTADELTEAERKTAMLEEIIRQTADTVDAAGDSAGNTGESFRQLGVAADEAKKAIGDFLNVIGAPVAVTGLSLWLTRETEKLRILQDAIERVSGAIRSIPGMNLGGLLSGGAAAFGPPAPPVGMGVGGFGGAGGRGGFEDTAVPGDSEKINQAMQDWAAERTQIEMDANADILEENNSYHDRRASAIADHEQSLTRMGEDFARQRARDEAAYAQAVAEVHEQAAARELKAAEDLAKSIARLNADHAKQQERWQRDLNESIAEAEADSAERVADATADRDERIAEARADSTERLAELEEDYTKDRERAARDHNLTLLEAASNLDARAVWAEQQRYQQEEADAEEAHADAVSEEQQRLADLEAEQNEAHAKFIAEEGENLQERINQEKKAHAQRVADANEAHAQRIADLNQANIDQLEAAKKADGQRLLDMQAAHLAQKTQEDTDYGIRLGRLQQDHTDQLTEMTTQHNNRITQIGTHAAEERGALDTEFEKRMTQLSGHEFDLETEQFKHQNRMLGSYQDYLDDMEREQTKHQIRMLRLLKETPGLTPAEIADIDAAITRLGKTLLEIGTGHVDPRIAPVQIAPGDQAVMSMLTTQGGPDVARTATIAGGDVNTVTIASGAIVINAAPGESLASTGDYFERRLLETLKKVAKS